MANKQTCTELVESVLRQAAEGVGFPIKEADAVVAQLKQCLADKFITQSQYDVAINAILRVDRNKARSVSVAQLSNAAQAAAKSALAVAKLPNVSVEPGVVIDGHWIIGIVLRNANAAQLVQYQQIAAQIADQLRKIELNPQPLPPGEKAEINPQRLPSLESECIYMYDHIVICGFRPDPELSITLAQ